MAQHELAQIAPGDLRGQPYSFVHPAARGRPRAAHLVAFGLRTGRVPGQSAAGGDRKSVV